MGRPQLLVESWKYSIYRVIKFIFVRNDKLKTIVNEFLLNMFIRNCINSELQNKFQLYMILMNFNINLYLDVLLYHIIYYYYIIITIIFFDGFLDYLLY